MDSLPLRAPPPHRGGPISFVTRGRGLAREFGGAFRVERFCTESTVAGAPILETHMSTFLSLRSFVRQIVPAPMARLARSMRLWRRRTRFRPYSITKTVQGKSFPFYIGDETGELWYGPEKDPVYTELAFIQDHMLSPGDVVFDVGSHHGLHTICMARHAARVVAIEPNPHNVLILKKNVALNTLQNVAVRQAAVGESCGKTILLQDSSQGGVRSRDTASLPTIEVEVLSLDRLADEYGFPHLLKIDVEGFEALALKGASQILQRRPKLAIEVHVDWVKRYGSTVREVVGLLYLESYRVWIMPYNLETVLPWNGEDFNTYPPPKFTLFLLPLPFQSSRTEGFGEASKAVDPRRPPCWARW